MMNKVDPCLFMSNTVICVVYVDDCLFWARSQSDTDNVMKYLKEDGPSYNWEHSNGESVSEFLGVDTNTLDDGGFQFFKVKNAIVISTMVLIVQLHFFTDTIVTEEMSH